MLTITGEKKKEEKVEREDYYRYERSHGSFCRRFEIPHGIDVGKIKAHFEDGLLEVRLPKTEEAKIKSKKISLT
jgi:HSP20 family protein